MIDLHAIDRVVMADTEGLDSFQALFYAASDPDNPVDCHVLRDTRVLEDEYGARAIQSGADISYLAQDIAHAKLGDWFEFDGWRYTIENKISTQDSSWRVAPCRADPLPTLIGTLDTFSPNDIQFTPANDNALAAAEELPAGSIILADGDPLPDGFTGYAFEFETHRLEWEPGALDGLALTAGMTLEVKR